MPFPSSFVLKIITVNNLPLTFAPGEIYEFTVLQPKLTMDWVPGHDQEGSQKHRKAKRTRTRMSTGVQVQKLGSQIQRPAGPK